MKDKPDCKLPLIDVPTGGGKSALILLAPYVYGAKRTLILAPSNTIRDQLADEWGVPKLTKKKKIIPAQRKIASLFPQYDQALFKDLKVLHLKKSSLHKTTEFKNYSVVVTNAQKFIEKGTLKIDRFDPKDFDLVQIDEGHHYPAETWKAIVEHFFVGGSRVIFYTGTPFRGLPKTMLNAFEIPAIAKLELIYQVSREILIDGGYIRPFLFVELDAVGEDIDIDIDAILISHLKNLLIGRGNDKAFYICDDTAHCKNVVDKFNQGQKMKAIGHYGNVEGVDTFHEDPDCRVIVVCGKLLEGYDEGQISIVVIGRGVRSPVLFNQCIGRASRRRPNDQTKALILTHTSFNQKVLVDEYLKNYAPTTRKDALESNGLALAAETAEYILSHVDEFTPTHKTFKEVVQKLNN